MIDFIDIKEWKTKREILKEAREKNFRIDERAWRQYVEDHNKRFWIGLEEMFIAHSSRGYKLTADKEEIIASVLDGKNRALNLLWKYSQTMRALGNRDNLKIELEERGIING